MENPKYQIYKGGNDQFYFRLKAANGEIILGSEGYAGKSGCENGIDSVKKNSPLDERYERKTASDGSFFFALEAANGETIGTSQMYASEQGRDGGIQAVKNTAPDAPVEDTA